MWRKIGGRQINPPSHGRHEKEIYFSAIGDVAVAAFVAAADIVVTVAEVVAVVIIIAVTVVTLVTVATVAVVVEI